MLWMHGESPFAHHRFLIVGSCALLLVACTSRPAQSGPALADEIGIVEEWVFVTDQAVLGSITDPDEVAVQVESADNLLVRWSGFRCQDKPVVELLEGSDDAIEIHLWRGELPGGVCEAEGRTWGFDVELNRTVVEADFVVVDHGD